MATRVELTPFVWLKPAAVSCSGVLDGTRLTAHKKDEDENVNDKHARYDESRAEPGGAKLSRYLQANAAAEIEKEITEPHAIEQPDRGDREPPARSKRDERQPREKRCDSVPDRSGTSEGLRKPRHHDAWNEKSDADESKRLR